jgi:hypothetical protein
LNGFARKFAPLPPDERIHPNRKRAMPRLSEPFHANPKPYHHFNRRFEFGGVVLDGRVLTFMIRKRGNPNWGRPFRFAAVSTTEFEMQVRQFHLTPGQHVVSAELRKWCEENRSRCYIPEWLLDEWGFRVDANLNGAA